MVHGAEIPFVFHQTETFDPASTQLADVMSTYWANFAATGNPNNAGQSNTAQAVPEWPTYSGDGGKILRIVDADNITAVSPRFEKYLSCESWRLCLEIVSSSR